MFKPNEGPMDRIVRAVVGIALLVLAFFLTGWIQSVLFVLALVVLITSATGYCGMYSICHIQTNDVKEKSSETESEVTDSKEVELPVAVDAKPEITEVEAEEKEESETEIETEEEEIIAEAKEEEKEDEALEPASDPEDDHKVTPEDHI